MFWTVQEALSTQILPFLLPHLFWERCWKRMWLGEKRQALHDASLTHLPTTAHMRHSSKQNVTPLRSWTLATLPMLTNTICAVCRAGRVLSALLLILEGTFPTGCAQGAYGGGVFFPEWKKLKPPHTHHNRVPVCSMAIRYAMYN